MSLSQRHSKHLCVALWGRHMESLLEGQLGRVGSRVGNSLLIPSEERRGRFSYWSERTGGRGQTSLVTLVPGSGRAEWRRPLREAQSSFTSSLGGALQGQPSLLPSPAGGAWRLCFLKGTGGAWAKPTPEPPGKGGGDLSPTAGRTRGWVRTGDTR